MNKNKIQKLQGTDGIRRESRRSDSSECKGLTPQKIFLEKSWITEQFMELYAYSHVKNLPKKRKIKNVVVGWDPRDPSGVFIDAVLKGVRKAEATVLKLGVVPTPLVPLYMILQKADCGMMITASHNPNDQNGIKLFSPFHGIKPLPSDDLKLSQLVLRQKYALIKKKPALGKQKNSRKSALKLFGKFTLFPENSWIDDSVNFKNINRAFVFVTSKYRP